MTKQKRNTVRDLSSDGEDSGTCQPGIKEKRRVITHKDLPLTCPLPNECLWDLHPRIYLGLDKHGFARCPYCSREFILSDAEG